MSITELGAFVLELLSSLAYRYSKMKKDEAQKQSGWNVKFHIYVNCMSTLTDASMIDRDVPPQVFLV